MIRAGLDVFRSCLPGVSPAVFGQSPPILAISRCGQRISIGRVTGVGRGAEDWFRDMAAKRGAALDSVQEVVEDVYVVRAARNQQGGGSVPLADGPYPGLRERFVRISGMPWIVQVVLVNLLCQCPGDGERYPARRISATAATSATPRAFGPDEELRALSQSRSSSGPAARYSAMP